MVIIDTAQPCRIAGVNIMQMDALTAFADLGIGRRPLTRLCQVQVKALVAIFVRNIEVDDDMVLRHLDIVEFRGIQL